ncbi:hypothetical protein [Paenibacillus peoriae]|uniref:hypothetical protein n=1 Tax=Paenibacillus peoriae TaxID=59893 RepID=UPI00286CA094|nr:hypothetical protein [Paenibacillus peoriae]
MHNDEVELLTHIRQLWKEVEERINTIEHTLEKQQNNVEALNEHVAFLKEEVGFKALVTLDVIRPALEIPYFEKTISRTKLVSSILYNLSSVACIALYGEFGRGKTQLAALVAQHQGAFKGWVRLRDLNPQFASIRLDEALSHLTNHYQLGIGKNNIKQAAAEDTIIMATMQLLDIMITKPTQAQDLAVEMLALCRQIQHNASFPLF